MTNSRYIVLALILGLSAWFFADALFGGGVFVFRDAGHYYYPLIEFVTSQWTSGQVPLWNPHENLGVPLAGNATSSVFYPGKLVFFLPLDYSWAYRLYVIGHVLLAAWAAYRLARHWGGSVPAAAVAAMSYAFSGNVLFQYCNVVFLVGAAWLPLAVLAADRMLAERSPRQAVVLGIVLALITLGGNAEMAYHAGLIAAMYGLWLWWYERRQTIALHKVPACGSRSQLWQRIAYSRPMLLGLAAATGFVLAAVQILPSVEFTQLSGRTASTVARSIHEVPKHLSSDDQANRPGTAWHDGLTCRRIERGTHHEHVYHFSVGPWRLAEYVWPNSSGRQFPIHRRWLEVVPGEGRVWVPSLYMGLLPLVLAVSVIRFRRTDARRCWLSWLVVLSLAAGLGWYGLGWFIQEARAAACGGDPGPWLVGEPFGGLYWLMTVVLPGYVYFRYPAKLLVITALALSMLSARGWDRAFLKPNAGLRRGLLWLGSISLFGFMAAMAILPFWNQWMAGVRPDALFGPLDTAGSARDLMAGFLQTGILCAVFWWLFGHARRGARWTAAVALAIVAVDLALANGWMVACAPAEQWKQPSKLAAVLKREDAGGDARHYRVYRRPLWIPSSFGLAASRTRFADAMQWERDTLWPKYNLPSAISIAEVDGTMKPYDYQVYLWVGRRLQQARQGRDGAAAFLPANVKYVISRGNDRMPGMRQIDLSRGETEEIEDVSLWHNTNHLPRAWIVHQVDVLAPLDSNNPRELWRRTKQVLYRDGRPRDLRESAVVEAEPGSIPKSMIDKYARLSGQLSREKETCRVARYDPAYVEIEVELKRPGLAVLCDQFYPGWHLEVETAGEAKRRMPILRANRVMRGAWLPAGRHRLTYRYSPASFIRGATISAVGWLLLATLGIAAVVARRRR